MSAALPCPAPAQHSTAQHSSSTAQHSTAQHSSSTDAHNAHPKGSWWWLCWLTVCVLVSVDNDKSPLENLHAQKLFETLKDDDCNVFEVHQQL